MPELPEIETIKRILEPQLAGRKITNVTVNNPKIIDYPEANIFAILSADLNNAALLFILDGNNALEYNQYRR